MKKRTLLGTLIAGGLVVGLSFNTNVRNVFVPGPDTLLITEAGLAALLSTVEDHLGPDPEVEALREAVRNVYDLVASLGPSIVETNGRVAQLSENVEELARMVALEPLPAVYVVAGDSVALADSVRTRWVWEAWRGKPFPERRIE